MSDGNDPPNIPYEQLLQMLNERTGLLSEALGILESTGNLDKSSQRLREWWNSYQKDQRSFANMVERVAARRDDNPAGMRR